MRLLYLTLVSPWSTAFGGGVRNAGILRGLARRHSVEVVLFTAESAAEPIRPPAGIERLHVVPLHAAGAHRERWWNPGRRRAARRRCLDVVRRVDPDVIWCFQKEAARIGSIPHRKPLVVDLNDVSRRRLARTAAQQRGGARLRTLLRIAASWAEDRWLARGADVAVLANAGEAALLRAHRTVYTVPNGAEFAAVPPPITGRASKRIMHLGGLWYGPNLDGLQWFLNQVWPRVLAAEPDAWLDVVGWSAVPSQRSAPPRVAWHGHVDDLAAAFAASALLVLPLRIGTGTRTKVLEAWSNGLPIASTSIGVEGLDVRDGETALVADTSEALADACLRLLRDPALGASLARRGFEHGRERFSWEAIYPVLEDVLRSAVWRCSGAPARCPDAARPT